MHQPCCAHLDLASFRPYRTIPVWYNSTVSEELQSILPYLGVTMECDVNSLLFPCQQDSANVISPTILNCADKWCAWDELLTDAMHYHLFVPDWSLYNMIFEHVGDQAVDLAPGVSDEIKAQTFVTIHHVPLPDLLFHVNSLHH